jgi:hypothetical protein
MLNVQLTPSLGASAGLGYNFKSVSTAARTHV